MRLNEKTKNVPIIFVTAISRDQKHVFKGYTVGAVDYLSKPLDPDILKAKVSVFLQLYRQKRSLEDASEALKRALAALEQANEQLKSEIAFRKLAEEALKTLSLKDDLTGLYNRRGFIALAEQGLKSALRMGTEMFLIFGDLDNLKEINDTLGHKEGDRALIETSYRLKEAFREADIVARVGGDEFVILGIKGVETSAEKLLHRLEMVLNDQQLQRRRPYTLSMSLGIACFDPQRPCSIDLLLAQADQLMYENKQKKRSQLPHSL
jgi:diguanylate cyclase (GGDEF)-like protein